MSRCQDKLDADAENQPTTRIAEWISRLSRELTPELSALATAGIRDVVGCTVAGSVEPTVRQVAQVAKGWGGGRSTIVGQPGQAPAVAAAFANGAAAHVLDFDDSYAPMTGHPSAPLVPAILAVAEERDISGAAVLDAYVVGLEVIATLGRAVNPRHYMTGWHSTATLGVIGAAAAVSRMLGLPAPGVSAAISNAVSFSSGSRLQLGSAMKSVHAGMAARDGIVAAMLAEAGVEGTLEPLLGPRGFASLYASRSDEGFAFVLPSGEDLLSIANPGLTFKPYPTCGSTHRSLDALLDLRKAHAFAPDEVASVKLTIPALNVRNLVYDQPNTGLEAKFSMHYCAAVALVKGSVTLKDFTADAVARQEVRAFMQRVQMLTLPGSEETDKDYLELPAKTVVRLKDGQVFEDSRFARRGSVDAPMPESAHRAKFLGCVEGILGEKGGEKLLREIEGLPDAATVHALMRLMQGNP